MIPQMQWHRMIIPIQCMIMHMSVLVSVLGCVCFALSAGTLWFVSTSQGRLSPHGIGGWLHGLEGPLTWWFPGCCGSPEWALWHPGRHGGPLTRRAANRTARAGSPAGNPAPGWPWTSGVGASSYLEPWPPACQLQGPPPRRWEHLQTRGTVGWGRKTRLRRPFPQPGS